MSDDRSSSNRTAAELGFALGAVASAAWQSRRDVRRDARLDAREQEQARQQVERQERRELEADLRELYPDAVQRESDMLAAVPAGLRERADRSTRMMQVVGGIVVAGVLAPWLIGTLVSEDVGFVTLLALVAAAVVAAVMQVRYRGRERARRAFAESYYDGWDEAFEADTGEAAPDRFVISFDGRWPVRA